LLEDASCIKVTRNTQHQLKEASVIIERTWARVKSKKLEASLSLLCTHTQDRLLPSHAADPATASAVMKQNCLSMTTQRAFTLQISS
jgi:hypothetical protein